MPQDLMKQLAKYEGYCCIYKYIRAFGNTPTKKIAKKLGVSTTSILRWRRRIKDREVTCGYGATGCGGCESVNVGTTRTPNTP